MKANDWDPKSPQYKGCTRVKGTLLIPLDRLIADSNQPRKDFDPETLERLAQSLKDKGQLLPIRARWDEMLDRWVIISGERRYRAARLAGLSSVHCVECAVPVADEDILEEQIIENRHRDDLKPIEQARAFRALMDLRGWSARQLARALYLSESSVGRALALLDLPDTVQARVDGGALPASVAYELTKVEDPAAQEELAQRIASEGLNRAGAVAAVREANGRPARTRPNAAHESAAEASPPKTSTRSSAARPAGTAPAVVERTFSRGTIAVTVRFQPGDDLTSFLKLLDTLRTEAATLFAHNDESRAA